LVLVESKTQRERKQIRQVALTITSFNGVSAMQTEPAKILKIKPFPYWKVIKFIGKYFIFIPIYFVAVVIFYLAKAIYHVAVPMRQ
jgi:hypothetical protein